MKTAIVFADGIKQIIFTPETKEEKQALALFSVDDDISLAIVNGQFGEDRYKAFRPNIGKCQGGYLRAFDGSASTMFVLTPKKDED